MFRRLLSLRMPEKRQRYIYYTCVNYDELDAGTKGTIRDVCRAVVAEHGHAAQEAYEKALVEFLVTGEAITDISKRNYVRPETLRVMRNSFYERFNREITNK